MHHRLCATCLRRRTFWRPQPGAKKSGAACLFAASAPQAPGLAGGFGAALLTPQIGLSRLIAISDLRR